MSCDINNTLKRKKPVSVPLSVKINALKKLKDGIPINIIANNLNVTKKTVMTWMSQEEKLKSWHEENYSNVNKKKLRKVENEKVDEATWFREKRAAGIPIQGVHVQIQAKIFNTKLEGKENFEASNGWLYKWQKRYNIRNLKICGEKLSADSNAADDFIKTEGYSLDEVFNLDETPLNYKMMPTTTLSAKCDGGTYGTKGKKERITVMACSNASGTFKFPLVVIGKYAKSCAIKHLKDLPVYYRSQKSAWITSSLFIEWFDNEFVLKVTEFLRKTGLKKAVLFMDNCAAHPTSLTRNNITVRFFPPNTTFDYSAYGPRLPSKSKN